MQGLLNAIAALIESVRDVVLFPLGSGNRIYWLYLATSVVAAFFVYRARRTQDSPATKDDGEPAQGSFSQFLFPRSVWDHPSAWLDLRYALFHKVLTYSFILWLTTLMVTVGYRMGTGGQSLTGAFQQTNGMQAQDWVIASVFMFVSLFVLDFVAWFLHYLQHKVPVLWQFHKVHHSAEVMHPLSNYREHPVDNVTYGAIIGLAYGLVYALAVRFFGFIPAVPTLLGLPVLMFLFNLVAYNLRHSHVWLRWPGMWSTVFPSPAHHQVHHSRHSDHIDTNFAFMFPVWDVIFKTYHMPEDNRDVEFGVTPGDDRDLDSVLRLYWVPFRDAFQVITNTRTLPVKSSDEAGDGQVEGSVAQTTGS